MSEIIDTVSTSPDSYPSGIAISGNFMYVANAGTQTNPGTTISKIRLEPYTLVEETWASGLVGPLYLATDNTYLYVANGSEQGKISRISLANPSIVDNNWADGSLSLVISGNYLYTIIETPTKYYDIVRINLTTKASEIFKNHNNIMPYCLTSDNTYLYFITYDVDNITGDENVYIGRILIKTPPQTYEPEWIILTNTTNDELLAPNSSTVSGKYLYLTLTALKDELYTGKTYIGRFNINDVTDINLKWAILNSDTISFGLVADSTSTNLYASDSVNSTISKFNISEPTPPGPEPGPEPGPGPTPDPNIPVSSICFQAGTNIKTDQGIVKIEKIHPYYHTIGNKPIIGITQTVTLDKYLVCFNKNSLGPNYPSERTVMTKEHKVEYNGRMVFAHKLLGVSENIKKVSYNGDILYNVLLENYGKMSVNNMTCETLHPENIIAKLHMSNINDDYKNNVIFLMNDCIRRDDQVGYNNITSRYIQSNRV